MKRVLSTVVVLAVLTESTFSQEAQWPHWRGPNRNGSVDEGKPPVEWSLEKNILWKVAVPGKGSATPIVIGDQIIVLTAEKVGSEAGDAQPQPSPQSTPQQPQQEGATERPEGQRGERGGGRGGEGGQAGPPRGGRGGGGRGGFGGGGAPTDKYKFMIISYDRETGEKKWENVLTEEVPHEGIHQTNSFASGSPATDGQHIYVDYGSRGIYCLDLEGNVKWNKSLGKMKTRMSFGEGASAAIHGNRLFVPWDHEEQSRLYALDATTGEILWKTERDELTSWGTPLVVEHKGRTQVIVNGVTVRSYDAEDGTLIWECGGQTTNPIPTPILYGDHVICMTGFRGNAVYCISLDSEGDVTGTSKVAWKNEEAGPYVPTGVLYKDHLYLNRANLGIVTSIHVGTGDVVIEPRRLPGLSELYSSPVAVNDHIYFTGRDGATVVFKHGDGLDVVARNELGETIDSSLVILGDRILVRGENHLFCVGEK